MAAVAALSALAVIDAAVNYLMPGNGISGSEGALLVVVSSVLMLIAAVLLANRWGAAWLRRVLDVLLVLDFIGTGAAAYFLEAWVLLALVVLAFVAWVAHLVRPAPSLSNAG